MGVMSNANSALHISCTTTFSLPLTTVLSCLVSCVLYHLAQLNFLHFMSIFADF